jgi:hypothetical protein
MPFSSYQHKSQPRLPEPPISALPTPSREYMKTIPYPSDALNPKSIHYYMARI